MSFFTGFATGFAQEAKSQLDERNKELREAMDEQFKEHKQKTQELYEIKKAERKMLAARTKTFDNQMKDISVLADDPDFKFSVAEKLAFIKDEKSFNMFQEDIRNLKGKSVGEAKARFENIKRRLSGVNNLDPNVTMEQAIEQATQVDDINKPVITSNRTAFGIPSNLQPRMLENYKLREPEAFKKKKGSRLDITGSFAESKKRTFSRSEAENQVDTMTVDSYNANFSDLKAPGVGTLKFAKGIGGGVEGISLLNTMSKDFQDLKEVLDQQIIKRVLDANTGGKGNRFVPLEILEQLNIKFPASSGLFRDEISGANENEPVYVGHIISGLNKLDLEKDMNDIKKRIQSVRRETKYKQSDNDPTSGVNPRDTTSLITG